MTKIFWRISVYSRHCIKNVAELSAFLIKPVIALIDSLTLNSAVVLCTTALRWSAVAACWLYRCPTYCNVQTKGI